MCLLTFSLLGQYSSGHIQLQDCRPPASSQQGEDIQSGFQLFLYKKTTGQCEALILTVSGGGRGVTAASSPVLRQSDKLFRK